MAALLPVAFALAPLLLQLALLSVLGAAVNATAYKLFGKGIYLLLMWPGVTVHELSHLVGCLLTRTRVRRVALFSPREEGGGMILGFVEHDRPASIVVRTIVAGAPFFGGAAAVLAIVRFLLPAAAHPAVAPVAAAAPDLASLGAALLHAFEGYAAAAAAVGAALPWTSWKTWLTLYLLFSIAAHISPSRPDLIHAAAGAVFLAAALFAAEWVAAKYAPGVAQSIATWTAEAAASVTVLLGYGLAALAVAWAALTGLAVAKEALLHRA
jgi:hypothetical protein